MGPIRIQTSWRLAVSLWIIAAPVICLGQPIAQLPTTSPQNNPWIGNPPQNGMFPPNGYMPQPSAIPTGNGTFDPYAPAFRPNTAPVYPATNPMGTPTYPGWSLGDFFGWSQPATASFGASPYNASPNFSTFGNSFPVANQPMGQPPFPSSVYPNSNPNVLFPTTGGFPAQTSPYQTNPYQANPFGQPQNNWWNSTGANLSAGTNQVIRLFQGPRFRQAWLPGGGGSGGGKPNSLQILDSDVSLVFAIPNFLNSTRPFYVIPSYSQHEWTGPSNGSDLPGSAFSAFVDFGWETNPQQTLGFELGVRVGVFSAFDAVNSESIRYPVKALGRLRLTPTSTIRAGVFYIDRNKIKLLPAVGLLWMPNQDTRFDLFFPEPKLSHYVSTLGKSDVWWYLSGYYGGGAWTIKQTDGSNDDIDINDIRVMLGLEFGKSEQIRQGFRLGFIEGGYAFNRELIYRVRSSANLDLADSFVLRAGFAY